MVPIVCATCSQSCRRSSSLGVLPVRSVQNTTIASPLISSGRDTTAASATAVWLTSALSISMVLSRCLATLMTSSTRPSTQMQPSLSRCAAPGTFFQFAGKYHWKPRRTSN